MLGHILRELSSGDQWVGAADRQAVWGTVRHFAFRKRCKAIAGASMEPRSGAELYVANWSRDQSRSRGFLPSYSNCARLRKERR